MCAGREYAVGGQHATRSGWAGAAAKCVVGKHRAGGDGFAGSLRGVGQHVAAAIGAGDGHGDADIYDYGRRDEYRATNQDTAPCADEYATATCDSHADAQAAAYGDGNAEHGHRADND